LDEVDSARIFLASQEDAEGFGRSILETSIIRFHQFRKYLLDCFRLVLQQSLDINSEENTTKDVLREVVKRVVENHPNSGNEPKFASKCLKSMEDIKSLLRSLVDKINGASVLGYTEKPEFSETIEYQRVSLIQQHESLAVIVFYLAKANHSSVSDFESLLDVLKKSDKYDNILVHSFLIIAGFISVFGALDGSGSLDQARKVDQRLVRYKEQDHWTLHYVYAAIYSWWLAEYNGYYQESSYSSSPSDTNLDDENKQRSQNFMDSLKDGAFHFILSLSADVKSVEWLDPTRHAFQQWLVSKCPTLIPDLVPFSDYFQIVLMEQLESFIDAFITNMPDVLRKLRVDEEEQRQLSQAHKHDLDLERFLVTIAFTYEGRPDAAQAFWSDPDSNLAGFLHWASRRASTPLVSAFCEMLQSLAEDEECATAAHRFLLDEGASGSGKMRRSHPLTWSQIFKELTFFFAKIRDRPALPQSTFYRGGNQNNDQAETEPESEMMLESYLRLISRLCVGSPSARQFLLEHSTFHITELLFQLAGSDINSRLRACAFLALRSLLSNKTKDVGEFIWTSLDAWISGGQSPVTPKSSAPAFPHAWNREKIFQGIQGTSTEFEEPNAFVQLLHALVLPYPDDLGLRDSLPFPEGLGSSNRMPGIDPYVDFAIGEVFGYKTTQINDFVQKRLLCLTCLEFMGTCLSAFNEDLVIFANQSNVVVDSAIGTSDLATYVRLHPFSRVMEWIFNDGVMAILFGIMHQDVAEISNASPDSPLVLCLRQAIYVVSLVMDLQATYLDIVKPIIKLQPTHRRPIVANAAFASFEDGVLNHLSIVADLGLYCGAGHTPLTIASLKLLEKISTASKIVSPSGTTLGGLFERNKAIAALESHNDGEIIARSLLTAILSNLELDQGPESDAYIIKSHILDFFITCLGAVPGRPSIAHLLLGFQCGCGTVDISYDGPFSRKMSLFHAILSLVIEYPIGDESSGILSWLISIKYKAFRVLKYLWISPLSSDSVITALRSSDFMINMFAKEVVVSPSTLWDGRIIEDEEFMTTSSPACLFDFIRHRATLLQYAALEIRLLGRENTPSRKERVFMALQGYNPSANSQPTQIPAIFEFFDFMELEIEPLNSKPQLIYFKDVDFEVCLQDQRDSPRIYDLRRVQELIILRQKELLRTMKLQTTQDESAFLSEANALIASMRLQNQVTQLYASRLQALEAWVQVMLMIIESGDLERSRKTSFVLHALQIILPKFEKYNTENLDEALKLAKLAKCLLFSIEFTVKSFQQGDMGDFTSDRLFQLFRVCLRAIYSPIANSPLKEILYSICYQYLTGMSEVLKGPAVTRRHSTHTVQATGERLLDVICDDAYAGEQTCRISALLLLGTFVTLAKEEGSNYFINALIRLNLVGLIVDSIKHILEELRESKQEGR
jgi:nuclear pore complex protein Nup205